LNVPEDILLLAQACRHIGPLTVSSAPKVVYKRRGFSHERAKRTIGPTLVMDGESQNAQDARVEQLWRALDTRKEGQLDLNGLKRGLRKMDHRESHGLPKYVTSDMG